MFTFCNVLHEIRQKTQTNSRECALEIIFNNNLNLKSKKPKSSLHCSAFFLVALLVI